jgi:hypothetical protein
VLSILHNLPAAFLLFVALSVCFCNGRYGILPTTTSLKYLLKQDRPFEDGDNGSGQTKKQIGLKAR